MKNDKVFKRRREQRKRREIETRPPRCETFLIVTEGAQTEPNYFKGLVKSLTGCDADKVREVDIQGKGRSTGSLVDEAERIVNRSTKNYDNVDEAINLAERKGYHVAWSNESFEYWLCLYFGRYDSALSRDDWCDILDDKLSESGYDSYEKNREDIFDVLNEVGDHDKALRFARSVRQSYGAGESPSRRNPCTTVDLLVDKLTQALEGWEEER